MQTPEKYKGKKTKKLGAAVEEEHLLLFVDICDYVCMQVDIEEAYVSAPIVSIDYGFENVTDDEDIPEVETPQNVRTKRKCPSGKQAVQAKQVCTGKDMKTTTMTWSLR